MKYLGDVRKSAVKEALDESIKLQLVGRSIQEVTPSAGKPQNYFIEYSGTLHPLKAIIKNAMLKSGIDPSDPFRKEFTSHIGRDWLNKFSHEIPCSIRKLDSHAANEVADFEKSRKTYEILSRPNQAEFRNNLLKLYNHRCPITDCRVLAALEAAHIIPKGEDGCDDKSNGILLRADMHRLFDRNLCAVCPETGKLFFSVDTKKYYKEFDQKILNLPPFVSLKAFSPRWLLFHDH